jgi:hypothetical protein
MVLCANKRGATRYKASYLQGRSNLPDPPFFSLLKYRTCSLIVPSDGRWLFRHNYNHCASHLAIEILLAVASYLPQQRDVYALVHITPLCLHLLSWRNNLTSDV